MSTHTFYTICLLFLICSCGKSQNKIETEECKEGINLLPLYGNIEKCKEQKQADSQFLIYCDSIYSSRIEAAKDYVHKAWDYADRNDRDNATKRFNQAYLLDSLNADVYWGLGIIQGSKKRYVEAENLFKRSLSLNLQNEKVWFCLAVNNKEQYGNEENQKNERKRLLKKALEINPNFYPAIQMIQAEDKVHTTSKEAQGEKVIIKHRDETSTVITQP